jgi:uncharacterized membrane protein YphA (DoxX/SURF4 family)
MDSALLAARVVLAVVFAVAAVGKFLDLEGSRRSVAGFGVPERLAAIGGTVLPFIELALAVALLPPASAQWAAAGALALMLAFMGGIANAMVRGEAPDCGCFGALHSAKAGWTALGRNAGLAALAAFVAVAGPGPSIGAWVTDRTAAEVVAVVTGAAAILLLGVAVRTGLENRRLRRGLATASEAAAAIPPGLPVGSVAPAFEVPDGRGGRVSLESLCGRGLPVALVFVRAGCGPSEVLVPHLEIWAERFRERLTVALVGYETVVRYQEGPDIPLADALELDTDLKREMNDLSQVFSSYGVRATPSAVIVSPEGTIASATVDGRLAIEGLLRLSLSRTTPPSLQAAPSAA